MMASTDMIKTVMNAVKVRLNSLTAKISKLEDGVKINTSNIENELNELPKKMDKTNPVATGSFSLNRMNGSVVGTNSFAEGQDTTASGNSSHAEGSYTTASGNDSHAEGYSTKVSGNGSHAEGHTTTASGNFSHAEGYSTKASGEDSHAEGHITTASGNGSHAEGYNITASGKGSHAEGAYTTASGFYSHSEGYNTTASGTGSHAEGADTTASGEYSHAEGYNTTASDKYSHAEGTGTTASGDYSHAEGDSTTASSAGSHAEGYGTTASGLDSHSEGYLTTASGNSSHAEGISTKASGNVSHAEGHNTTAISDFQHVQGKYNIFDANNKYAHIVGNGTSNDNLSNAHTLDWKGNAWFAGTVEGKSVILSSSATDSTKKFKVTVDDTGEPTFTDTSDSSIWYTPYSPPIVTSDDAGKFLRVSSTGEWAAETISEITAEPERVIAESERVIAESERVAAESERVTAETERVTAETERVAAESKRVTAESERVAAESKRATAETERATAETERATAESKRVTAESERVTAETERANTFAGYETEINQFKNEIVTGKDSATNNTKFAIGEAEPNLEVPTMEEFNQLAQDVTGKLSEPAEGLAVGKYFRVAALDANGHAVLEAVDAKTVGVQDVQVAGASVVADGVANIPIANEFKKTGVVRLSPSGGVKWSTGIGALAIDFASQIDINTRVSNNRPLIPYYLDYAVKAAMCDGKGAAWTADEQAAARERMSVENGSDFELLVDAVLEEEANTFLVQFPKPVRECIYHIWFYNNNSENVTAQTKCLNIGTSKYYLLKYTSNIKNGYGYVLNGYFRYNGPIKAESVIGYASESSASLWTSDTPGNGNVMYMNYPTDLILDKADGIQFYLNNPSHVLNAGAVIKVWGR